MAWIHVEYQYPVSHLFAKELIWADGNLNVYFGFKLLDGDDWTFYAGNASHALEAGNLLTSYGTSEAQAQANYLTTTKDDTNKILALLPANFQAKYARLYVESGSGITVHEWTPSTYFTAHEIVSGTLEITDQLAAAPLIKVVKSSVDRLKIGNFSGETYGIAGYDDSGNKIFELSNEENKIGGLDIEDDKLIISGEIIIDATEEEIRTADFSEGVFGKGWRIKKDEAEFQNIKARGKLSCSVFEKESISAIGGNLLITEADVLAADMDKAAGTLTISGTSTFASGEILRIKNGSDDEWIEVTDVSGAPTYNVIRDLASSYPSGEKPQWKSGTAVVSTAISGEGFIVAEASDHTKISVFRRNSSIWNDYAEVIRIGNLKDYFGYLNEIYGLGIGDDNSYLKYDPSYGLRIKGDINSANITGTTITGGEINTAATGRRIQITSDGIALMTGAASGGSYGEFKYGEAVYGSGILAWINNISKKVPFYINEETENADFHFYNRTSDPTGAAEIGDVCVNSAILKICTGDGTPGTWQYVDRCREVMTATDDMVYASAANTPARLAVAANRIIGKKDSGNVAALTGAEAWAVIGEEVATFDYSGTSTVVGFSSFSVKQIYIKKIGKLVHVDVYLYGTSNTNNDITFTLPYANALGTAAGYTPIFRYDNGTMDGLGCLFFNGASSIRVTKNLTGVGNEWTASGNKGIIGHFTYITT